MYYLLFLLFCIAKKVTKTLASQTSAFKNGAIPSAQCCKAAGFITIIQF